MTKRVRPQDNTDIPKRAIGYIRVSTEEQGMEDRYGIEAQQEAIAKYASENGYEVVDYRIEMESGTVFDDKRPVWNNILYGDVTNPPIQAVIAFKSDRISRNMKFYFYWLVVLERRGIKLLSANEQFQEGDDMANIYRALALFVAEQERKNILLRTSKGRNVKAASGAYGGGRPPYGYKAVNKQLVIDEDERKIVEYVFKRLGEGVPCLTIADELTDMGYRTRKGTHFHDTNIRSIRDNWPLYKGMYRYGPGAPWVKGVHEPILKTED